MKLKINSSILLCFVLLLSACNSDKLKLLTTENVALKQQLTSLEQEITKLKSQLKTADQATTAAQAAIAKQYPPDVIQNFMNYCQNGGMSLTGCKCFLQKIQEKYTAEQFSTIDLKIQLGSPMPDDFVNFLGKARLNCPN